VHRPRRSGRIGLYDVSHLRRLELIGRLQERGHSLAGISDLLAAWRGGDGITEVLGLAPDQLVHVDEPGAPATLSQLAQVAPALVPHRLDDLLKTGIVEACGPDEYCVPSPSLLQLTADALDAGLDADATLALLHRIRDAADLVADGVLTALTSLPTATSDSVAGNVLSRGRGLLAHGMGRLSLHRLGRRLGVDDDTTADEIAQIVRKRSRRTRRRS
jgi:DNA-binding transcriptional MerR regulator